ncbi:hypothetical protein D3C79_885710 [compost metagenome]
MGVGGEEHFADTFWLQQARLIEGVVKDRFFEETHLVRAVAVHKPFIITINVGDDIGIVVHHAEQVGGDIAIEVMGEDQITVKIVHAGTVGGDHVGFDLQIIADLPHIDVMAARRENKIHAAGSQEF